MTVIDCAEIHATATAIVGCITEGTVSRLHPKKAREGFVRERIQNGGDDIARFGVCVCVCQGGRSGIRVTTGRRGNLPVDLLVDMEWWATSNEEKRKEK